MPIRVLVVDDSLVCREMLAELLGQAQDIQVVGTASNGKEAIALNQKLQPDFITMDVSMPGLDGFGAIEEIMATQPVPILMVTSSPIHKGVNRTFQALSVGALDLVQKPELDNEFADALRDKVRLLAGVPVVHRRRKRHPRRRKHTACGSDLSRSIVAITSSTGGPRVLMELLTALPRDYPGCILVTQHLPSGFSSGFADWLNSKSALEVSEACDNDPIRQGRVLIAPSGRHLVVESRRVVTLSDGPPLASHRPSGSVMFHSLAQTYGSEAVGLVLSGMGTDGAEGLLDLHRAGGLCIVQDETSSLVYGMPKAAIDLKAVDRVLDVQGIIDLLMRIGG